MSFGAALVGGLIVPLVIGLVELPVELLRALGSRDRWLEARCEWPAQVRITWRTSREHARVAQADVLQQLGAGYGHLAPRHATFIEMSRPPGTDDLDI